MQDKPLAQLHWSSSLEARRTQRGSLPKAPPLNEQSGCCACCVLCAVRQSHRDPKRHPLFADSLKPQQLTGKDSLSHTTPGARTVLGLGLTWLGLPWPGPWSVLARHDLAWLSMARLRFNFGFDCAFSFASVSSQEPPWPCNELQQYLTHS